MKRTKQCPKCQSLRIGYLPEQPDADDVIPDQQHPTSGAPAVGEASTLTPRMLGVSSDVVDTGFWMRGRVSPLVGKLEAFVCTECGYHETYVTRPKDVPWDRITGFMWLNADGDGPYR